MNRRSGGQSEGTEASVFLGFISGTFDEHRISVCIRDGRGIDFVMPRTAQCITQVLKSFDYLSNKERNSLRGEMMKMEAKESMTVEQWRQLCSDERACFLCVKLSFWGAYHDVSLFHTLDKVHKLSSHQRNSKQCDKPPQNESFTQRKRKFFTKRLFTHGFRLDR